MKKSLAIKFLLLSALAVLSSSSFAGEGFLVLPSSSFEIKSENALQKLDDVVRAPELILRRFNPRGAKIKNKQVSQSQIQFLATKTYLMISKTVFVHGVLDLDNSNSCRSKKQMGYLASMDFAGSSGLLTDNIEKLEVLICVTEVANNDLNVVVNPKMIKGNNYSDLIGGVVKSLLTDQVNPLIDAIREEMASRK